MQLLVIQRVVGLLLMLFALTFVTPLIVALLYDDGTVAAFLEAFGITFATGLLLFLPVYRRQREIRVRDGFLIVTLFWTVLGIFGAVPLIMAQQPAVSITNAVFESISGLTTTGATVLTGIDELPASIRFYRQQLQWLGGMGIVVLAVAVMPMLGVGGMQLYRAETPGPIKDTKLTPRITETAKALWYIYLGLTVICAVAYWVAGMSFFDAIGHSFSTIAIGGFSTHDDSLGYFNSAAINAVAVVFMLLAGLNFALHFHAWHQRSPRNYLIDPEARTYFRLLATLVLICIVTLLVTGAYDSSADTFNHGIFQVVSIATTTGFTTTGFAWWPLFLPVLLMTASFIGGCAGSTAGGMKVIRALLLYRQGMREIRQLIHPSAVILVKIGGKPVPDRVLTAVWGFFSLYVVSFTMLSLALSATGLDLVTAFSAVVACLNNLGPGLAGVSQHYADISDLGKWILCTAMLLGRLELFTLLVLLTPSFWRG